MEKIRLSLEWKSEEITDDESGDSERGESEEDWLGQGWRGETGSLFEKWGDTWRNEWFVINQGGAICEAEWRQRKCEYSEVEDWREIKLYA